MTDIAPTNSSAFWQDVYRRGRTNWDLGAPTPVFQQLLREKQFAPGRMIVLGAGRGHDARAFARHGFAVVAVDFAADAVREMQRLAEPDAPLEIMQADIFDLPRALEGTFDYALEYVTYCAIDPSRRAEYADVVARLLKARGVFIALAFPLDAAPSILGTGGPPFTVSVPEILELFHARGFTLLQRGKPAASIKPRAGREELLVLQKSGLATESKSKPEDLWTAQE